jgi:hypothetical protein
MLYFYFPDTYDYDLPVHLDIRETTPHGRGGVPMVRSGLFHVFMHIHGPDAPENDDVGTFMVTLRLGDDTNRTLAEVAVPYLVPFVSTWSRILRDTLLCLPRLFGWCVAEWVDTVRLVDAVQLPAGQVHYDISVSTNRIRFYDMTLHLQQHSFSWLFVATYWASAWVVACYLLFAIVLTTHWVLVHTRLRHGLCL